MPSKSKESDVSFDGPHLNALPPSARNVDILFRGDRFDVNDNSAGGVADDLGSMLEDERTISRVPYLLIWFTFAFLLWPLNALTRSATVKGFLSNDKLAAATSTFSPSLLTSLSKLSDREGAYSCG